MFIKEFEKDLDVLEELPIHIVKSSYLRAYATDDYALNIYVVRYDGTRGLFESVASAYGDLLLRFDRLSDGTTIIEHLRHGDDNHELTYSDSEIMESDVQYIIVTANEEVTIKYYEYND